MRPILLSLLAIVALSIGINHQSSDAERLGLFGHREAKAQYTEASEFLEEGEAPRRSAIGQFQLRRSAKAATLRMAIREKTRGWNRGKLRKLRAVLNDPDKMEMALAHAEWLEATAQEEGSADVLSAEGEEQGPVLRLFQFFIENWDQIQIILEFLFGLGADSGGLSFHDAPDLDHQSCVMALAA